jgi:pimeloyl-ACP methyl ester carboxylesterase
MPMMAESVKKILDKENIHQCTMMGHSMGGYVTLAYAALYPEALNGLVLLHSHPDADTSEAAKNRERAIELIRNDKGGFISSFIPSLYYEPNREHFREQINRQIEIARSMKPESIIAAQQGMKQRKSSVTLIETIQVPILFIIGKQDTRANLPRLLEHLGRPAHSEALILDRVGHMGFLEASHEILSTLHHFAVKCSGV